MRVVSPLTIIASLALYVNAAVIDKRAISTPVQTCINDINVVSSSYALFSEKVTQVVGSMGYRGMLEIHLLEQRTEKNITLYGIPHCCSSAITAYTDEEATAVIDSVSRFSANVVTTMEALKSKLPEVNKVLLMRTLFKIDIGNLDGNTTILDNCLVKRTPANKLSDLTQYIAQIDAAYDSAYALYNSTT